MNSDPLNTTKQEDFSRQEPQQGWQQGPQQDWQQGPQQDWQQGPQQDWQQEPQQDWQQEPQQDWQQEPQQGWQQEPQQGWSQEMSPPTSLTDASSAVRKNGLLNKGMVISATIAALLLIGGGFLGYAFYGKGEKLLKRTNFLKSDIYALSDETALLRKKYDPVKQTVEALAQASRETDQFQASLEAKKKEVEKIRQEHSSTLSKLKTTQHAVTALEQEKIRSKPSDKQKDISQAPLIPPPPDSLVSTAPSTNSVPTEPQTPPLNDSPSGFAPVGADTVQAPHPVTPTPQLDRQMVEQGAAYLKARKTGDISYLSKTFAPRSNYMYADGKEASNTFIMNDIQKFWNKWPFRDYRLLKVAYSSHAVELIYFYECSNRQGKTIRGYTKEMWQTSPSGQIIRWNEVLNSKEAPDSTPGYRSLKLNY